MSKLSSGKNALFISDRSGLAFPYTQMAIEWNGARVHISEYEPKQPQLDPRPFSADPQGLANARPARTEFPTTDFLPKNPFTTNYGGDLGKVSVSEPYSARVNGDIVRFYDVKNPVGGVVPEIFELQTTLAAGINDTTTSILLNDSSEFPASGYIIIEKVIEDSSLATYGLYDNEVIQYTGNAAHTLTGCTRGTNAPFRGATPANTTASAHSVSAKVRGGYEITMVQTTQKQAGQPSTVTLENSYTFDLVTNATSGEIGGGLNCLAGPINDNTSV
jgi:hypothetical protein